MLDFERVTKYYGGFLALEIPSLTIEEGIWWVQGENGSGKTTFLKMVAGLHPFTGNIVLDNRYSLKRQRQKFVSLVNYSEAEPLYPSFLTAKDLVELFCKAKGGNILEAEKLLRQLNVFDSYKKPLGSYSSGMIKKLSLVLAFIGNPRLILLDEPLITIDAKAIDEICMIIRDWHNRNVSFIITSHQTLPAGKLEFNGKLMVEKKTIIKIVE